MLVLSSVNISIATQSEPVEMSRGNAGKSLSTQKLTVPKVDQVNPPKKKKEDLIVDEMSMIGRRQMGMIDSRLCQVFPVRSSQPFGGTSLILVGDFGQLSPVCDTPLYMAAAKGVLSNKGRTRCCSCADAIHVSSM